MNFSHLSYVRQYSQYAFHNSLRTYYTIKTTGIGGLVVVDLDLCLMLSNLIIADSMDSHIPSVTCRYSIPVPIA